MLRRVDKKNRILFQKNEINIIVLKFLLNNFYLKNHKIFFNNILNKNFKLFIFLKENSYIKIHNYCIITGRSRGILSSFKVSRIIFREKASRGLLLGLFRASW